MKTLSVLLVLSFAAITHAPAAQAQAQSPGGWYYAEAYTSFCMVWQETHVCSQAETYATFTQGLFLSRVGVSAIFSGPAYYVSSTDESTFLMLARVNAESAGICAHSGWHDLRSTHTATIIGNRGQGAHPAPSLELYAASLIPYCDCQREID